MLFKLANLSLKLIKSAILQKYFKQKTFLKRCPKFGYFAKKNKRVTHFSSKPTFLFFIEIFLKKIEII